MWPNSSTRYVERSSYSASNTRRSRSYLEGSGESEESEENEENNENNENER